MIITVLGFGDFMVSPVMVSLVDVINEHEPESGHIIVISSHRPLQFVTVTDGESFP